MQLFFFVKLTHVYTCIVKCLYCHKHNNLVYFMIIVLIIGFFYSVFVRKNLFN